MKRIGLLSDTHSFIDDSIRKHLTECDEIWHAGDIGNLSILDILKEIAPVRAVWGNIDGNEFKQELEETLRFTLEKVDVVMKHIGGYPGNYDRSIKEKLKENPPKLFISGHSHILKVMFDDKLGTLHINPGAAGRHGFHKVRTLVRFTLDNGNIGDMEVVELGARTGKVVQS